MKISVALCTYNGGKFLGEQLSSIFSQTLPVDEVIICDDCSTDNTVEIIQKYILRHPSIITFYKNEKPLKTIKNFEKAISLTTGDYIFLCDQDDVWKPEKVQKMIVNMKENPKALLLFTNGDLIDERSLNLKSTLWARWNFNISERNRWSTNVNAFQNLIFGKNYVTGATALLRRKLLKTTLPIEVPSNYYHDAWFALHAAAHNGLYFMDQCLIDYRIHKDQQVGVTSGGKNTSVMVDKKNISFEMFRKINHHKYPLIVFKIAYLQYLSKLKRKFL